MAESKKESENLVGRELLLDVALELFMERGFDGVSIQQIATAANMTKGSPYYHFKGKDDIFLSAYVAHVRKTNTAFQVHMESDAHLTDRLIASFTHILSTINPGMMRLMDDYQRLFRDQCPELISADETPPVIMRRAYAAAFASSPEVFRLSPDALAEALLALQIGTLHSRMMSASDRYSSTNLPSEVDSLMVQDDETVGTRLIHLFLNGAIQPGGE